GARASTALRSCALVRPGFPDSTSAASAAAWGAAAEVPKNGLKPGTPVVTPSADVMSGFARTMPPVEVRFAGVNGVPSGAKYIRRGPSEVKRSGSWEAVYTFGNGPIGFGGAAGGPADRQGAPPP